MFKFCGSVEKLVDNMVLADQTELVNKLLNPEIGLLDYDEIQWPSPECSDDESDDEGYYPKIYSWKLINPWYRGIIECKAPIYGMAYLEYGGQLWLGKTTTNALTEWEYLKGLCIEE